MKRSVTIYIGPPGTGKTTKLLSEVEKSILGGIEPQRIAYMAFSKAAANDAKRRAVALLSGIIEGDLIWFRTIHSAAFKLRNLTRDEVMNPKQWTEFGGLIGTGFAGRYDPERWMLFEGGTHGDKCLRVHARSIARNIDLIDEWRNSNSEELSYSSVERFRNELEGYKNSRSLLDFIDMLEYDPEPLDIDVLIIDEAQDLTAQQWRWIRKMGRLAKRIIIAGDDDQAIYNWAGADANLMRHFKGEYKILPVSYRLPKKIKSLADSIIERVSDRIPKTWAPREKADGEIYWWRGFSDLSLSSGKWLLLGRHHHILKEAVEACRAQGIVYYHEGRWSNDSEEIAAVIAYEKVRAGGDVSYSEARLISSWITDTPVPRRVPGMDRYRWEQFDWPFSDKRDWMLALTRLPPAEREYIRSLRRNKESLTAPGRVRISTIHGAKGWEEDNVSMSLDISRKVSEAMLRSVDDEQRVFYVGTTRAKETLHLIQPHSARAFKL